ncbi:MAG: hypothetical protein FWB80_07120 [Defluviitaleaceae bacterium]|nr:hypothetical protein [Defluviitaleaceae bacterium]
MFKGKKIRSFWSEEEKKWWFSAVDLCAILINRDYDEARKYWNHMKRNLRPSQNQLTINYRQLKMKSADSKMRFGDALDIKLVFYVIMIIPSKEAEPYKLWLAEAAANGTASQELTALAKANAETTEQPAIPVQKTITRRKLV